MSENLREKLDKIWSDEQRKAFRDAMAEELEKRLEIMRLALCNFFFAIVIGI